jgi:hypothetical protein
MESNAPFDPLSGDAAGSHVGRPRSLRRAAANGLARGFAGGLVATVAMSTVMVVAQKAGLMGHMPPKKISDGFLAALGIRRKTPEPARKALATLNHFAFGGACGALFGLGREVWRVRSRGSFGVRRRRAPIVAGLAFGTAVWAVSYMGWVPAMRIMPKPQNDRTGRPTSMVLAHWVFGAVLAKIVR